MKTLIALLAVVSSLTVATQAHAAAISDCGDLDSIGYLMSQNSFGHGNVNVAYISTEEPAASPDHVLIFIRDSETGMGFSCTSVNADEGKQGFGYVNLNQMKSSYSSSKGLLLEIPVNIANYDSGLMKSETVKVRVNQKTEKVTLE